MRKAFTLIELLVVVVVIVTLMAITFRLGGVGSDSTAQNKTVNRLQRLENCLSGYYAAYGTYPPVKLHGSRDWTMKVDPHGLQYDERESSKLVWEQVEAACRSQPVGMSYPFKHESSKDYVSAISSMLMDSNPGKPYYQFEALLNNSTISSKEQDVEWVDQQIFQYGVLSYLLPRYLIMMGGDTSVGNDQIFKNQAAWTANNQLPADFETGIPYTDWARVNQIMKNEPYKIAALPSQAATARWLPNLEKSISTVSNFEVYGIELRDGDDGGLAPLRVYTAGNSKSFSQQYLLDGMTIKDGWGHEFYYYSPPPHQSYRIWSAGKNGKTFPPWVSNEEMSSDGLLSRNRTTIQSWISDDITQMSN